MRDCIMRMILRHWPLRHYHEQFTLYTLRSDESRLMRTAVCDSHNLQMRPTTQHSRTVEVKLISKRELDVRTGMITRPRFLTESFAFFKTYLRADSA